jgi:hypothetical protein
MIVPSTPYQLLILLLLVLPGVVYIATRVRLRGPAAEDGDAATRVLSAVMMSAALDTVYVVLFGSRVTKLFTTCAKAKQPSVCHFSHPRIVALYALVLIFVIPFMLAAIRYGGYKFGNVKSLEWRPWKRLHHQSPYSRVPNSWDFAAVDRRDCMIRVQLEDGRFVGGWFGTLSHASTYPEARSLFIEQKWHMTDDGKFTNPVDGSRGVFVPLMGGEVVEWIEGTHGGGGLDKS